MCFFFKKSLSRLQQKLKKTRVRSEIRLKLLTFLGVKTQIKTVENMQEQR